MTRGDGALRVLIGCEVSGVVRRAFRAIGADAWSCDLLPSEDNSPYHIQGDVLSVLGDGWDLMLAFPPCTYLCSSGLHWNKRIPGRTAKTEEALKFVRKLMDAPIPHIAIENPHGCISTRIRKHDQVIQPYQFGHNASKSTCLWLKNLPLLHATDYVQPRKVGNRRRWGNQTDSGQNNVTPSPTRGKERSRTYAGIGAAMADQWQGVARFPVQMGLWDAHQDSAAWIECEDCGDYWCAIHEMHAHECECPEIYDWQEIGVNPYTSGAGSVFVRDWLQVIESEAT